MDSDNSDRQAPEKKLSEEFAEFIDLTDEDLEEVEILEFGGVHGGYGRRRALRKVLDCILCDDCKSCGDCSSSSDCGRGCENSEGGGYSDSES